jgi:hypothetical protein
MPSALLSAAGTERAITTGRGNAAGSLHSIIKPLDAARPADARRSAVRPARRSARHSGRRPARCPGARYGVVTNSKAVCV